jgi:uncharacterized protein involved in tolerance to divalent cations
VTTGDEVALVVSTTSSSHEAEELVLGLLTAGLIAGANVLSSVPTLYKGEDGEICRDEETLILMRTTAQSAGAIAHHASHLSPDVELTQVSATSLAPAYSDWIRSVTTESGG